MMQMKEEKIKEEKSRQLCLKREEELRQCTFRPDIRKSSKQFSNKRTIEDLFRWEKAKKQKLYEQEFQSIGKDFETPPE